MFSLDGKLKFINVDLDYLKALHDACPEVCYKPNGYDKKPFLGMIVNSKDRKYVIPLTSAKEKHKTWKDVDKEKYLVYEIIEKSDLCAEHIWVEKDGKAKHIMSAIDIKKMIPIKEGVYHQVNLNPDATDTVEESKYKDLMNKEYSFCLKIIDEVISKANELYESQMTTGKVKKYCCDFRRGYRESVLFNGHDGSFESGRN